MFFKKDKALQQSKVTAGTTLIEAGEKPGSLFILHSGAVDHFPANSNTGIYKLGSNSCPGFASLIQNQNYPCKIVTAKDSVVSSFPVNNDKFTSLIMGKLNVGMMAVRSLAQEFLSLNSSIQRHSQMVKILQKMIDNLSLVYLKANPDALQHLGENPDAKTLMGNAKIISDEYNKHNGEMFPDTVSSSWIDEDHSSQFGKTYGIKTNLQLDEFSFLKRLVSLPPEIQGAVYQKDINILQGLSVRIASNINHGFSSMLDASRIMNEEMDRMYKGDEALIEKYRLLTDLMTSGMVKIPNDEFLQTLKYIVLSSEKLLSNYQTLTGKPYANVPKASIEMLRKSLTSQSAKTETAPSQAPAATAAGMNPEAIKKELQGSALKIMGFLGATPEESRKMMGDLKNFKNEQNPMDSGGDARKIRRSIGMQYIAFYEKALKKFKESPSSLPLPVKLMLDFGFFDEDLLDDEHLISLVNLSDKTKSNKIYPIFSASDWIDLVATKKEPPSVDEMGMTYFEKLKSDNKDMGWRKETDVPDEYHTYEKRSHYEIANFLNTTISLTSGSPATSFPILTRYQITIPLDKCFVTKKRLSEELDKILATDYSAFHREVIVNDEQAGILKEFVQERVIPNFIIVPSIGTKVMMWQDLAGRSKSSRGRLAVPVLASALDLGTMLLEAIGAFRWELTKSIQGADWNNVSIPSITADYTDYVQFFKKNRELSPELKEKLASEFKRFRTDRDRFVNDYVNWIKFESEGTLKLNKVVRGIFYRHVPFSKDIRDKIATQPAYMDFHNRFTNIRNRKLKEFETKYRKYGEVLPPILQGNLDFYKV
ncbi:MAG: cyclic nucleotide-binding domain-containing protein [Spirochaetia bacterium]|nr:cyclic nucleotide-binding domain-containing protein [Spirochaetia bacterium]